MTCTLCGQPAYSVSKEHENAELCIRHYKLWLAQNKPADVTHIKESTK